MKSAAHFEKVSLEQFKQDWKKHNPDTTDADIESIYNDVKLPERSSKFSAGYDFFLPDGINVYTENDVMIPTGIRCVNMDDDMVLMMFPRSGLGSKYRFCLANSVGIVDADYSLSDNEGHIFMKMVNDGVLDLQLEKGKAFCQGILLRYSTVQDDNVEAVRNGGFGSSNK